MSNTVNYVLNIEAAAAEASVRKAADAIEEAAAAAKEATRATVAYSAVSDQLSTAEREMAAKIIGSNAALEAQAKALGVSTGQAAALNAELKRQAAAQARASEAAERAGHIADMEAAGFSKYAIAARTKALASQEAANSSNNLQRGLSSVAMQMPDVIAQISAGTPPLRALTQQGLQVVQSMDMMTLAAKAFSPAGAAVAAAALTLGAAWAYLNVELTRAEEKMSRQSVVADRLGKAHDGLESLVSGQAHELAVLTGQYDKATESAKAREEAIRSAAAEERRALDAMVEAADVDRQNARTQEETAAALQKVAQAQAMREKAVKGVNATEREALALSAQTLEYEQELAASNEELARRDKAAADAAKARAAAEREKADALKAAAAAAGVQGFGQTQRAAAVGFAGNLSRVQTQTTARDFGFSLDESESMFKNALRSAMASNSTEDAASRMWVGALERAAKTAKIEAVVSQTGAALNAVVDPLSALSMAGPAGAATGEVLAILEQIGSQGTDQIVNKLEAQADAIVQGFASLPELINRLIEELPYSIGQSIAEALAGILKPGDDFFNPEKILNRFTLGLYGLGKGILGAPEVGEGFAVGDIKHVSRTGLALVHEGERMVRPGGGGSPVTRRMAGMGGGYAGPPIIIQAAAVAPDVLSGLSDVLGASYNPDGWGRGTRPVFGG